MKALVLEAYNAFVLRDVPDPVPGPGEVLVAVKACGICGSDVHGMDGSTGRRRPPIVMGHEAAGVVAALGPGVSGWAAGDRVTFDSTVSCGACWHCRRGEINLCDNRRVLGVSCEEYRRDGAFAGFVAVPASILYRLPDALAFEHAAMVEAVSIALHAVRRASPALGASVAVIGAGMIGQVVIQAARLAGCGRLVAVDPDPARRELAKRLGADHALDPAAEDIPARVRGLTEGRGADCAFEVVGAADPFQTAVAAVRKGGVVTLVGNLAPRVELPLQGVVTRELSLLGSCASSGEYPACLEMLARGRIDVRPLLSAAAPLAEGPAWFARLHRREPGLMKVVLRP
jgi:L-iditol 2-dehydrogenase